MMKLRVWYLKDIPGTPTYYHVSSVQEAVDQLQELIERDLADEEVFGNAMGLEEFDGKEWTEFYDELGRDIFEIMEDDDEPDK